MQPVCQTAPLTWMHSRVSASVITLGSTSAISRSKLTGILAAQQGLLPPKVPPSALLYGNRFLGRWGFPASAQSEEPRSYQDHLVVTVHHGNSYACCC